MKRAVILLNWNQTAAVAAQLERLAAWPAPRPDIWVVDNASTEEEAVRLPARFPSAHFIRNPANLGYAGGINAGLRAARTSGAETALLLNNDAEITPDAVRALEATLDADARLGAVGPALDETPAGYSYGGRSPARHLDTRRRRAPPRAAETPMTDVDYVPGTVALLRLDWADRIGGLDEEYFFSGEMADWCARLRTAGGRCAIRTDVLARHYADDSARIRPTLYRYYTLRNRFRYARRHAAPAARFYWLAVGGLMWLRAAGSPAVRAAVTQALRDGWNGRFGPRAAEPPPPRALIHLTAPPPALPGTDAMFQDATTLARALDGETVVVYPGRRPARGWPPALFGWRVWPRLRTADRRGAAHLIFNPTARAFPYLRALRGPLVYTLTCEATARRAPPGWLLRRARFVVPHPRAAAAASHWRGARVTEIRPGLDLTRIRAAPPPAADLPFTLLMASAPWTRGQFSSKGIAALLALLRRHPDVRLLLLWRGRHGNELLRRRAQSGAADRVEVVDRPADVNDLLARSHATVLLARTARIVKAWPHSLLETLAAGRPTLLSATIPMSDYVVEKKCGVVVSGLDPAALDAGLKQLRDGYAEWTAGARAAPVRADFDPAGWTRRYAELLKADWD